MPSSGFTNRTVVRKGGKCEITFSYLFRLNQVVCYGCPGATVNNLILIHLLMCVILSSYPGALSLMIWHSNG